MVPEESSISSDQLGGGTSTQSDAFLAAKFEAPCGLTLEYNVSSIPREQCTRPTSQNAPEPHLVSPTLVSMDNTHAYTHKQTHTHTHTHTHTPTHTHTCLLFARRESVVRLATHDCTHAACINSCFFYRSTNRTSILTATTKGGAYLCTNPSSAHTRHPSRLHLASFTQASQHSTQQCCRQRCAPPHQHTRPLD
jgi:hypothetical protein